MKARVEGVYSAVRQAHHPPTIRMIRTRSRTGAKEGTAAGVSTLPVHRKSARPFPHPKVGVVVKCCNVQVLFFWEPW